MEEEEMEEEEEEEGWFICQEDITACTHILAALLPATKRKLPSLAYWSKSLDCWWLGKWWCLCGSIVNMPIGNVFEKNKNTSSTPRRARKVDRPASKATTFAYHTIIVTSWTWRWCQHFIPISLWLILHLRVIPISYSVKKRIYVFIHFDSNKDFLKVYIFGKS